MGGTQGVGAAAFADRSITHSRSRTLTLAAWLHVQYLPDIAPVVCIAKPCTDKVSVHLRTLSSTGTRRSRIEDYRGWPGRDSGHKWPHDVTPSAHSATHKTCSTTTINQKCEPYPRPGGMCDERIDDFL